MAFVSKGYDGPIYPADWSFLVPGMASTYNIEGDGLATTSTGVLQTTTTAGTAAGYGITDTEADPTVISSYAANTVAGTTRWDLLVLRRTWSTGVTALVVVPGSTSQATAIGMRTTGRTVVDDQPIALVPIIAGASNPGTPIDLRLWTSSGGATANSDLFRYYCSAMGSQVQVGSDLWQRIWVAGIATWVPLIRAQGGFQKFTVATPTEAKSANGVALTDWISIAGPPRPHSIRVTVSGKGGYAGSATQVGVIVQRAVGTGILTQDTTLVDCAASQWVSMTNLALLSGLPANTVTQLRCAANGSFAFRRGAWAWDVI